MYPAKHFSQRSLSASTHLKHDNFQRAELAVGKQDNFSKMLMPNLLCRQVSATRQSRK